MQLKTIEILDTTLRDGVQAAGVVFSLEDKIKLLRSLDDLGVSYIRGGESVFQPQGYGTVSVRQGKAQAEKCAPGRLGVTRRPGSSAGEDPGLRAMLQSGAHIASIVGKSCKFQVLQVLGKSPEENLRMIEDTVRFLTGEGMSVFFDAEHFFDGWKSEREYALETLRAARRGGASRLVLCDTNGGSLPEEIAQAVGQTSGNLMFLSPFTATTTRAWPRPPRWRRFRAGRCRCRGRSTAMASVAATPTSAR